MKRLLKTPARIAIVCIALLAVLVGTSYAALARGSESSSKDPARSAKSAQASGPAAKASVERRLERSRHAARPQAPRAKPQAKARAHAKARKAVQTKQSSRRPVATPATRATKPKPRVVKPKPATTRPTRSRKARRSDRSRPVRKPCGRHTSGKGSDQPAPVTPCKRSSTQPPPPPPPPLPPPPPQPGDDR